MASRSRGARHFIFKLALFIVLSVVLLGCRAKLKPGVYEGALFRNLDSINSIETLVQITVTSGDSYTLKAEVENIKHEPIDRLYVQWDKFKNEVHLYLPSVSKQWLLLKPNLIIKNGGKCYTAFNRYHFSACFRKETLSFHVSKNEKEENLIYSLSAKFAPNQTLLSMEPPKVYRLTDLLKTAKELSFKNRTELERVRQAKSTAQTAFLNLFPHVGFRDLMAIGSANPMSIATFVADFVPFVIPTRWMKLKDARDASYAEMLTYDLVRAGTALQVQTLAYYYQNDRELLNFYDDFVRTYEPILNHVTRISEGEIGRLGNNVDEMSLRLGTLINTATLRRNDLKDSIETNLASISHTVGFQNPDAITAIDIEEPQEAIENAVGLDYQNVIDMTRRRDIKLRQIDYLLSSSAAQKLQYYFNWTDPEVPAAQSISLSLKPLLQRASSVIQELIIERQAEESKIAAEIKKALLSYSSAIEDYKSIKLQFEKFKARDLEFQIDILAAKSSREIHASASNVQWLLTTKMLYEHRLQGIIASYRIARSKINLYLAQDYYSDYHPKNRRPEAIAGVSP